MKNTNKKGFTLVELVIVIAVIAILAAVLIPTFTSVINTAKQNAKLQEVKAQVDEAYLDYLADKHEIPVYVKVTNGVVEFVKTWENGVFAFATGNVKLVEETSYFVYLEITSSSDNASYSVKTSKTALAWATAATNP